MKKIILSFLTILTMVFMAQPAFAQEEEGGGEDEQKEEKADKGKKSKEKSYADIITDEAVSDEGLFTVHKMKDKYYFEVPTDLLEKEILVVSRISGHVKGLNFGGAGMKSRPQQVVRWQLKENKVLLRSVSYNSVADASKPI